MANFCDGQSNRFSSICIFQSIELYIYCISNEIIQINNSTSVCGSILLVVSATNTSLNNVKKTCTRIQQLYCSPYNKQIIRLDAQKLSRNSPLQYNAIYLSNNHSILYMYLWIYGDSSVENRSIIGRDKGNKLRCVFVALRLARY